MKNLSPKLSKLEFCTACLTLLDGVVTLVTLIGVAVAHGTIHEFLASFPYLCILGILSGAFALRKNTLAWLGAWVYYAVQSLGFASASVRLIFMCGISLALTFNIADGTLIVNTVAIAGLMALGWILVQKRRETYRELKHWEV